MASVRFYRAPGLGDVIPGCWAVPQNPVTARRSAAKAPGVGEILNGYFAVPQNPLQGFALGNGQRSAGKRGGGGVGDISTDLSNIASDIGSGQWAQAGSDFATLLEEPTVMGIPLWLFLIGGWFFLQMVMSHGVSFGHKGKA